VNYRTSKRITNVISTTCGITAPYISLK